MTIVMFTTVISYNWIKRNYNHFAKRLLIAKMYELLCNVTVFPSLQCDSFS